MTFAARTLASVKTGIVADGHGKRITAQHRNRVGGAGVVGFGLKMDAQGADFLLFFCRFDSRKKTPAGLPAPNKC